ncbi:MAG: hypothetical protein WCP57_02130 [Bacteroidota bacterium]
MKKILILISSILLLSTSILNAQANSNKSSQILGSWELKQVDRKFTNPDELNKENYFFYDAYTNHSLVNFTTTGMINLYRNKQEKSYEYKLTDTELIITFYSADKSKVSATYYSYKLEGNTFRIWRKDPMMSESYTFTKK